MNLFLYLIFWSPIVSELLVLPNPHISGLPSCAFSSRETQRHQYCMHTQLNELHTVVWPICPKKFAYRPLWQGPGSIPIFWLSAYFVSWYRPSGDPNPKSSTDRPAPIRIMLGWFAISRLNLGSVTEQGCWLVWPPYLLSLS